jgi:hypothetical protein
MGGAIPVAQCQLNIFNAGAGIAGFNLNPVLAVLLNFTQRELSRTSVDQNIARKLQNGNFNPRAINFVKTDQPSQFTSSTNGDVHIHLAANGLQE